MQHCLNKVKALIFCHHSPQEPQHNVAKKMIDPPPSKPETDFVQMFELVTNNQTIDGSNLMDVKPLLKLMDICTCASAEKHTGVNCVTVSMGDVVFEHFPTCGEMLELTARPVFTGTTSLDIALTLICEGEGGVRRIVCDAVFTYVTTKGPQGEKRLCPPLGVNGNEETEWAKTIAQYRRALVKTEQKNAAALCQVHEEGSGFDMEMTEVVLPAHQNHMGHTFGGVVMAWMAKAALSVAARTSKRSAGSLLVRSVLRVDFRSGSDVSDHLIFRPRLNSIFDGGRSAEVEVRVSKRCITTGVETSMNVGFFYISGSGTTTDIPFSSCKNLRHSVISKEMLGKTQHDAAWRRRLLLARQQLLGGIGEVVEWHPTLHDLAPILTILSVLRLVRHNDSCVYWRELDIDRRKDIGVVTTIEWTPGEAWGRSDTFSLRAKGVVKRGSPSLASVLQTLKTKRPEWDTLCMRIDVLEEQSEKERDPSLSQVHWDVVQHMVQTSVSENSDVSTEIVVVPISYLRAWTLDPAEGTAVIASQSVLHPKADKGAMTNVRPSGWFANELEGGGVELTYILEANFVSLRRIFAGRSDIQIVEDMGRNVNAWFEQLGSFDYT